jgi:hypothetical protein
MDAFEFRYVRRKSCDARSLCKCRLIPADKTYRSTVSRDQETTAIMPLTVRTHSLQPDYDNDTKQPTSARAHLVATGRNMLCISAVRHE